MAPSFVEDDPYFEEEYNIMAKGDIWEVIRAFGEAAARAKEAHFDAVQVHAAHGYLISQFLSPYTNRRQDEWGGALENRVRFLREIYQAIRTKVGDDYPILIKIGVKDEIPGGFDLKDGKWVARCLEQWGFDALEVSQGLRGQDADKKESRPGILRPEQEAYFRDWSREIKKQVKIPVMIVGGLRSFNIMEEIVQNGEADFISLSRPFIREPDLINRWEKGDDRKAKCISCNKCSEVLENGKMLHCVQIKTHGNL
jgi:2,4-dienoyl-CoA reductase-like NADH-dependent reductase (Old Yellow Enzyme family)